MVAARRCSGSVMVATAVNLPNWVKEALRKFEPPPTGKVVIELETYNGGVTKFSIGGIVRVRPDKVIDDGHKSFAQG